MPAGDWKLDIAIVEQTPAQEARLDSEVLSPERGFDGDLPQTGGAEEQLVVRI